MAYREVTMVEVKAVLRQWLSGKARKSIARWVRVDRNTVRRYIQVAKECGLQEGGGIDSLTEERLELILEALRMTARGRRRGDGWEWVGQSDDRLGIVWDQDFDDSAEEGPRCLARLDCLSGPFAEIRVDEPVAGTYRGEDERTEPAPPSGFVPFRDPIQPVSSWSSSPGPQSATGMVAACLPKASSEVANR